MECGSTSADFQQVVRNLGLKLKYEVRARLIKFRESYESVEKIVEAVKGGELFRNERRVSLLSLQRKRAE